MSSQLTQIPQTSTTSAQSSQSPQQPQQQQQQQVSDNLSQNELNDPINKCKELNNELKKSMTILTNQLSVISNPNQEPNKLQVENQFQILYKQIDLVNKLLDNLTINLRVLHEMQQIQHIAALFERQTLHLQPQDPKRNDLNENPIIKQFSRINEIRTLLQNYSQSPFQQ